MLKRNVISILSGLLAIIFTIYISMDTFVISHVYQKVEASTASTGTSAIESNTDNYDESNTDNNYESDADNSDESDESDADNSDESDESDESESDEGDTLATISDNSYSDENIQISLTTYRENDTDIYVADITLSSSEYLKTALAQSAYGKNITDTTSNIAEENNAILAINGDYYGVQESGYVIRNGVIYRSTSKGDQEDLAIYQDGTMKIVNEKDITAEELLEDGVYNLLCFGPGLITDGQISVTANDEVDKAMTSNPRTAIGVIDDLHYVFVVADGRTTESEGLSLYELAQFMQKLGVTEAYNLDGGGSSTLYFNGQVINNPSSGSCRKSRKSAGSSSGSSERSVSDIVYIGYE